MAWDSAVINLDEALTRSMGRKELYKGWLDSFFRDETFNPTKEAFANSDNEAAHTALHKFKGTAGNLSVMKIYAKATALCERVIAKEELCSLEDELKELHEEFLFARQMYNDNIDELLNYGELIF
jgi:HPt (histidine-containing phosphotransfer) domain-containing protein